MEGENSSSSSQRASRGRRQGGPDRGHCDRRARYAGGVYIQSASPLEMQNADTPILPVLYCGPAELVPVENMVIGPCCSPGSPDIEFVRADRLATYK